MDDKTNYHWNTLNECNSSYVFPIELSKAPPHPQSFYKNFVSPIFDWFLIG